MPMRTRMVVMAIGVCRSGLSRAATRDGKRRALLEQMAVGRDASTRMVTKATPTAALVVAEFLFEFQPILPRVGAFDAPAPFGEMDEMLERCVSVAIGDPELGGFGFTVGPVGCGHA